MPDKSQQFMTDEFVAGRSAEANQAKVATGAAIGQGIVGGVNEWQKNRQISDQHDAWIANVALRQRDQEMSAHAQAFDKMVKQQEMARRQQETEGELALKTTMRQEYAARMAETAQRGQLNQQLRIWQEQVEAAKLQNEAVKQSLQFAEAQRDAQRDAQRYAGEQDAKLTDSIVKIHKSLADQVTAAGTTASPFTAMALERATKALAARIPNQEGRSIDPEGDARNILGTKKLPLDVHGESADIQATLRLFGDSPAMDEIAKSNPQAVPKITEAVAANIGKLRSFAMTRSNNPGKANELVAIWLRSALHEAGDWQTFVKDLNDWPLPGKKK